MKKLLLPSLFSLFAVTANAQLQSGTQAPNFTATDLNGDTHTLSTYLNQDKLVLLNISATWCGPCWNYHNTHALADFYEAYGPVGSNEAMVLYVEGDPSTPVSALYGEGNNTFGDWTLGTPYPIIDSGAIASSYAITFFPTLYRICSNGVQSVLQQLPAPGLRDNLSNNCSTLQGVPNHIKLYSGDIYSCDSSGGNGMFSFKNYGNNPVTEAVAVLKENGTIVSTSSFSGNIAQFSSGDFDFSSIDINTASTYTVEVQSINGGEIHHAAYGVVEVNNVAVAEEVANISAQVKVYTDNYPGEISWRIKDSSGNVVANAGPYQAGPGQQGAGGSDANTTKTHTISISPSECYSIELLDAFGDGWSYNSSAAPISGLEVFANGESVIFVDGSVAFSQSRPLVRPSAFRSAETLSNKEFDLAKFSVYPNPTTGLISIATDELVNVKVLDVTGKIVQEVHSLHNQSVIDLSSLQKGVYLLQVKGESFETTRKVVLN